MKKIALFLIIAAIMLSLLPLPVYATTATIGYTSVGALHSSVGNHINLGNYSVTPAHSGIATSMTAYVSSHLGTNQYVKYALYDASGNWIANTVQGNISTLSPQWITLNFSTPVYITAGAPYLIAVWGSYTATTPLDYAEIYYNIISSDDSIYFDQTYVMGNGNWPTSISPYYQHSSARLSLYLTYTESTPPSISILASHPPTQVATTSAVLWAYLNNDGGELCSVQFSYSDDGGFTWTYTTPTAYGYKTGDSPFAQIAITGNTTYYYKAYAINSLGNISSGVPHSFTSYATINPPTSFTAIALGNGSSISLHWVIGSGSASTMIRWKIGEYPNAPNDTSSTLLCNTIFNSYTHTDLTAGDTIYYSAWGVSGTGNSTTYATDYATVSLGSDETTFTNPDLPTNWFIEVDYTKMSGVPFYGVINEVTDSFGINKQFMWGALGFMIGLMVFIASYRATQGNALSALLATTVILAVETGMGLMAGFIVFLFVIMAISLAFVHARA